MGVVHGPGHMEVKYTTTGPCLVEVGTRCHGGEGTWQAIAEECLGYNQVTEYRRVHTCSVTWICTPSLDFVFSVHRTVKYIYTC